MSKTSTRRPSFVSDEVLAKNWDRIFAIRFCFTCEFTDEGINNPSCAGCNHLILEKGLLPDNWKPKEKS